MAATTIYTKLNPDHKELRVLVLEPHDDFEAQLNGRLLVETLTANPRYNALSYVWGTQPSLGDLRSRIDLSTTSIPITPNLADALRRLRSAAHGKEQILWVDALCINQEDLAERSSQVEMMRDIYSSAEQVTIWLGDGDAETDEAFDSIPLLTGLDSERDTLNLKLRGVREHAGTFYEIGQRPWFYRMWVMQELAMAKRDPTVLCGSKSAPWSALVACWKHIAKGWFTELGWVCKPLSDPEQEQKGSQKDREESTDAEVEVLGLVKMDVLDDMRKATIAGKHFSFQRLVYVSRTSLATDPRDRIYALLGMLKPAIDNDPHIVIDYRKTSSEVYVDAMRYVLAAENGPYLLAGVALPGLDTPEPTGPGVVEIHAKANLPSWVPDFNHQTLDDVRQPAGNIFHPPADRSASGAGSDCTNGKVLPDLRTLQVEGLYIDMVSDILPIPAEMKFMHSVLDQIESMAKDANGRRCAFDAKVNEQMRRFKSHEPLWRALIANKSYLSGYDPAPSHYEHLFDTFRRQRTSYLPARGPPLYNNPGNDNDRVQFEHNLRRHLAGNVLFVTQNGFVGICTPLARQNDHLALWFGSPVPFVLRPATNNAIPDSANSYALVGPAYVSGIMAGEMVDELYCEDLMDSTTFYVK